MERLPGQPDYSVDSEFTPLHEIQSVNMFGSRLFRAVNSESTLESGWPGKWRGGLVGGEREKPGRNNFGGESSSY